MAVDGGIREGETAEAADGRSRAGATGVAVDGASREGATADAAVVDEGAEGGGADRAAVITTTCLLTASPAFLIAVEVIRGVATVAATWEADTSHTHAASAVNDVRPSGVPVGATLRHSTHRPFTQRPQEW